MERTPQTKPNDGSPYGSVADLPSYQEMSQLIRGAKLLTRFVAKGQRQELLKIEREMNQMIKVVDDFYQVLGPRNWIFHDLLNISKIEAILSSTSDAEEAERGLIRLYQEDDATKFWVMRLRAHEGLRERTHQIERARAHYQAGHFDSCTLQLIAVMDGFVNDFEPHARKGLASRAADDMTAWDSVVGHHMGLANVMKTFTRTIKRRIDEEVYDVYRHGIVHGSVVRFDNVVVATKAWNMLFSVADWATATRKAAEPVPAKPTWRGIWSTFKRQAAYKKFENEFVPSTLTSSQDGFDGDDVVQRAAAFLDAWEHGRWALVAAFAPPKLVDGHSKKSAAHDARLTFERHVLKDWKITTVHHERASASVVHVAALLNGEQRELRIRMVLWAVDGNLGMPHDEGACWRLAMWAPNRFVEDPRA